MSSHVKLTIVGDCADWNQPDVSEKGLPTHIKQSIEESDAFIFNLEGPIFDNRHSYSNTTLKKTIINKLLAFYGKSPQPAVVSSETFLHMLHMSKANVACLANNHILDNGKKGIAFTIGSLEKNGFFHLGAGANNREAATPLTVRLKDKKIGIVNYNFIGWRRYGFFINIFGAGKRKAGANYPGKLKIKRQINRLSKNVDFTLAVFHIGRELRDTLHKNEIHFLESLQADLVIIHHAHVRQNMKSDKIVSCGDFIFSYPGHLPDSRASQYCTVTLNDNDFTISKHTGIVKGGVFHEAE